MIVVAYVKVIMLHFNYMIQKVTEWKHKRETLHAPEKRLILRALRVIPLYSLALPKSLLNLRLSNRIFFGAKYEFIIITLELASLLIN